MRSSSFSSWLTLTMSSTHSACLRGRDALVDQAQVRMQLKELRLARNHVDIVSAFRPQGRGFLRHT